MHIKFSCLFRAVYASCMLLTVAAIMTAAAKQPAHFGEIKDIETNVTLHDAGDILQLLVNWKDNLPKGTSYNVIVMAQNASECSEPPCSLYGISKGKEQLRIPAHPMPYVDQNECGYMFGCNYSLVVETSNAMVAHNTTVQIPYCVLDTCSCRHAATLPKVELSVHIPSNDTIYVNWSVPKLKGDAKMPASSVLASRDQWQLHLKVSEQTNPSLSWGGKLIPITEHVYPLKNVSAIMAQGAMNGSFKIKVPRQLDAKVMLNLRSYLIDELHCPGPEHQMKVQVPDFFKTEQALAKNDFDLTIALTIVSALFACTILCALGYYWWRRKKAKLHASITHKDDQYLSPFATIVDTMEDNLNYVDKYVEEAQAKGLADVFEVPHSAIHMGAEIGEGAFGRVYKATALNLRRMRGPTVVAVKQLKKNPSSDEVAEFLGEIEMLKGVSTHHNIVCFLGCCTIRSPYLMIMEYVGRGDLLTYLRTVRHEVSNLKPKDANYVSCKPVEPKPSVKYIELKMSTQSVDSDAESERQPKQSIAETTYTTIDYEEHNEPFEYILSHKELHHFALQIANGMRFLEEQEITHRDLAARNVLIDDHKTLKISDFGLSRHGIYTNTKTRKLPLRWLSIEAIRDNVYSSKSDVWAYGVVLWEIGTLGASPYPTISNHELIPYLLAGKRLEKPEICTDQVYALMLQCWDEEADRRPSFAELYKALSPRNAYVDINSLSDDYVFPPIKDKDNNIN